MSLILCGCDRRYHFTGDPACPADSDNRRSLLKGMAWAVALSVPIDALIAWGVWSALKALGVL